MKSFSYNFLISVVLIHTCHSGFETHFQSVKSQVESVVVSQQLTSKTIQDLKADFHFMLAKPHWQPFTKYANETDFIIWLTEKREFNPVWKAVGRYARPDSKKTFDSSNKKNSNNLKNHYNQRKILEASTFYSNSLQEIESTYTVNSEILIVLAAMESRLGKFQLKYLAHEVFLTQLFFFSKFTNWMSNERLERLTRSARRNLVCLYFWASSGRDHQVRSNWAGACGVVQFLPYNFWMLRDGNGDGIFQFSNLLDGFASSAYFLNNKGWKKNQYRNFVEGNLDESQLKALLAYNRNEFYAKGLWSLAQWLKKSKESN